MTRSDEKIQLQGLDDTNLMKDATAGTTEVTFKIKGTERVLTLRKFGLDEFCEMNDLFDKSTDSERAKIGFNLIKTRVLPTSDMYPSDVEKLSVESIFAIGFHVFVSLVSGTTEVEFIKKK